MWQIFTCFRSNKQSVTSEVWFKWKWASSLNELNSWTKPCPTQNMKLWDTKDVSTYLTSLSDIFIWSWCSSTVQCCKNMNISSDEYLCIVRVHKYSNDRAADGHLPAAFSWLSVLPLEFCTEQIHNPLITFYLRERHKVHRCINIQMNINGKYACLWNQTCFISLLWYCAAFHRTTLRKCLSKEHNETHMVRNWQLAVFTPVINNIRLGWSDHTTHVAAYTCY